MSDPRAATPLAALEPPEDDEPDSIEPSSDDEMEAALGSAGPAEPVEGQHPALAEHQRLLDWIESPNIAKELPPELLDRIGQTVKREYDIDWNSCSDWREKTLQAMEMAMQVMKPKTYPWPGASAVVFPLMTTASIEFAARAYPAIVSGQNVVRGKVIGDDNGRPLIVNGKPAVGPNGPVWLQPPGAKLKRAEKIGKHMSWQLLEEQPEWEDDTDKLLHVLPIIGCVFRKSFFDPPKGRNASMMVSAVNVVIKYNAKSVESAPRVSEEVKLYPIEIEENVRAGIFLDNKYGLAPDSGGDDDAPHEFIEQHRRLDLDGDGYAEPYIVTVHKQTTKVARIVARYDAETVYFRNSQLPDQTITLADFATAPQRGMTLPAEAFDDSKIARIEPIHYYTKFDFLPNPDGGIYGIGFGHLLRPINDAVNTTINQMLDAGHLANTGGGFIGKGLSMATGAVRFRVGEWKVVNSTGGSVRENVVPLQFGGPNTVLFQLLGLLIQAGKDISAVKDVLVGEQHPANMPAATVLALIEQGLKVFTGIYKRVHRALKAEYLKLFRLNRVYLPVEAVKFRRGDTQFSISRADYAADMAVEPVSDPSMVSDMQRMAKAEWLGQWKDDPMFDGMEIRRRSLDAAQIEDADKLLKQPTANPAMVAELYERRAKAIDKEALAIMHRAQAVLYLAQAEKSVGELELGRVEAHLELIRTAMERMDGGSGGTPGPQGNGGAGNNAVGLPAVAAQPGL